MRRLIMMMTTGVMLSATVVWAAEEPPKTTATADTSVALKTCEQRVTVLEQTLNGLAQGMQKELEIAGLRLKAHLPSTEGSK